MVQEITNVSLEAWSHCKKCQGDLEIWRIRLKIHPPFSGEWICLYLLVGDFPVSFPLTSFQPIFRRGKRTKNVEL